MGAGLLDEAHGCDPHFAACASGPGVTCFTPEPSGFTDRSAGRNREIPSIDLAGARRGLGAFPFRSSPSPGTRAIVDDATTEKIARNNAAFRDANDRIETAAADHGFRDGRRVPFLCECSDERCITIVRMTLDEYERVRSNPRWFAHAPGHEVRIGGAVEPVEQHDEFVLVEKIGHAGDVATDLARRGNGA